jgi:hypothetical protein
MKAKFVYTLALATLVFLLAPQVADAYVGPGSGITVIGAALAFVGGVFLTIVGFIWYPVKRLWRRIGSRRKTATPADGVSR